MILIHVCTGGFTHMLCTLGITLLYAKSNDYSVFISSESHKAFQASFASFFDVSSIQHLIADESKVQDAYKLLSASNPTLPSKPHLLECAWNQETSMHKLASNSNQWDLRLPPPAAAGDVFITSGFTKKDSKEAAGLPSWQDGLEFCLSNLSLQKHHLDAMSAMDRGFQSQYIGAHFRNSDKINDINDLIEKIKLAMQDECDNLYWASDDPKSIEIIRAQFPNLNIVSTANTIDPRSTRSGNLHYSNDEELKQAGLSRLNLLYSFLYDVRMLVDSDKICYSADTDVTRLIQYFRDNKLKYEQFFNKQIAWQ